MPQPPRLLLAATLAAACVATPAPAQPAGWAEALAGVDSVGPHDPGPHPGSPRACGPAVHRPDSVEVGPGAHGFELRAWDLRMHGWFRSVPLPAEGAARFEVRAMECHPRDGYPIAFVVERAHRHFTLAYPVPADTAYPGLRVPAAGGEWRPYRWADPAPPRACGHGDGAVGAHRLSPGDTVALSLAGTLATRPAGTVVMPPLLLPQATRVPSALRASEWSMKGTAQ